MLLVFYVKNSRCLSVKLCVISEHNLCSASGSNWNQCAVVWGQFLHLFFACGYPTSGTLSTEMVFCRPPPPPLPRSAKTLWQEIASLIFSLVFFLPFLEQEALLATSADSNLKSQHLGSWARITVMSLRIAWSTYWVSDQCGLQSKNLSQIHTYLNYWEWILIESQDL